MSVSQENEVFLSVMGNTWPLFFAVILSKFGAKALQLYVQVVLVCLTQHADMSLQSKQEEETEKDKEQQAREAKEEAEAERKRKQQEEDAKWREVQLRKIKEYEEKKAAKEQGLVKGGDVDREGDKEGDDDDDNVVDASARKVEQEDEEESDQRRGHMAGGSSGEGDARTSHKHDKIIVEKTEAEKAEERKKDLVEEMKKGRTGASVCTCTLTHIHKGLSATVTQILIDVLPWHMYACMYAIKNIREKESIS